VALLTASLLRHAGFLHAFPEREVSDGLLLEALGTARVVQVRQVHGARVVEATEASPPAGPVGAETRSTAAPEADALIGRGGPDRMVVGVRVADCVPVLVADEASGAVAAIHAGWRGVVAGVVPAALERMGGRARACVAAIGPCIGACCFEVGGDVAGQTGFVVRSVGAKAYVDLRAAVRAQLRACGIDDARIEDVPGCTRHEGARFHSFRRDGANSGRMLAAIAPAR
jgi:YfiH family protein